MNVRAASSLPTRLPVAAKRVAVAPPAPVAKAAAPARPAVKAQAATPAKTSHFPWIASIGTAVSAAAGGVLGLFACGMSDAPVSAFETLKMAGGTGLIVGGIGAAVFFGGTAIYRALKN